MRNNKFVNQQVVTQIGIVVNDIEKTAAAYAEFFQIKTPEILQTGGFEKANTRFYEKPSKARAKLAFIEAGGNLVLELIEPDMEPSTWREHLNKHGEGPHHIAFEVEGIKEKIGHFELKGMPLVQKGEYPGGEYAYMDSYPALKIMVELLENEREEK